VSKKEKRRD
jgi:hypothetical protein